MHSKASDILQRVRYPDIEREGHLKNGGDWEPHRILVRKDRGIPTFIRQTVPQRWISNIWNI